MNWQKHALSATSFLWAVPPGKFPIIRETDRELQTLLDNHGLA